MPSLRGPRTQPTSSQWHKLGQPAHQQCLPLPGQCGWLGVLPAHSGGPGLRGHLAPGGRQGLPPCGQVRMILMLKMLLLMEVLVMWMAMTALVVVVEINDNDD